MPFHKIPRGHLHEDIKAIEHDGEVVVAVTYPADDPGFAHVFTRWLGQRELTTRQGGAA